MGIFGKGFALNRLAKSVKSVLDYLSIYRRCDNIDYLYKAAWLCKYGVYDSIEKWKWHFVATKIWVPDYQELGRLNIHEVMMIVTGKIMTDANNLPENQRAYIEDILEGGDAYSEVAYLVPVDDKNKFKP